MIDADPRSDPAPSVGSGAPRRGWGRATMLVALLGGLLVVVLMVVVTSHRGPWRSTRSTSASRGTSVDARTPTPTRASSIPPAAADDFATPRLEPDASGRIRIPLSDVRVSRVPAEGVPEGWSVKEFAGHGVVSLVRDEGQLALKLTSARASFALYRDVIVDLAATPWLTWSWKVTHLPPGGDVRSPGTDDEAAQLYVVFPRWPAPLSQSDVLGYVWDSRAPVQTRITSPKAGNVKIIVLRSGDGGRAWQREARDVAADYVATFGRTPPRVGTIALMVDSNDTQSEAEALFSDIAFSPSAAGPGRGVPPRVPTAGKRS